MVVDGRRIGGGLTVARDPRQYTAHHGTSDSCRTKPAAEVKDHRHGYVPTG
jgi:hypothetical protein